MRIRFVLAALSVAVAVSSCGPVTYSSSENLNLKSVREYAFIEPVADVLYYGSKNKPVYDYELSDAAADLITTIVSSQRYPFSEVIYMDYDRSNREIRKWIQNIGSVSTSRLDRVRVPRDLLDAIDTGMALSSSLPVTSVPGRPYVMRKRRRPSETRLEPPLMRYSARRTRTTIKTVKRRSHHTRRIRIPRTRLLMTAICIVWL